MTVFENTGFPVFAEIGAALAHVATVPGCYIFSDPETDEFVAVPADFAADLIEAGALPVC